MRPRATRRNSMAELLNDAVEYLEGAEKGYRPQWIVRLQVTFPFRPDDFIDRAIKTVIDKKLDSAFVALPEFDTFWRLETDGVPERLTTDTRVPRARRDPIYRWFGGLFLPAGFYMVIIWALSQQRRSFQRSIYTPFKVLNWRA